MEKIMSSENNSYKKFKKLKQKKYRDELGLFLAEGHKFLDFKEIPEAIIIRDNYYEEISERVQERFQYSVKTFILDSKLFKELSTQENSQGIIFVYPIKHGSTENLQDNIVILDRVADPGNLGTIIRLCDAAGFNDILLTKGSVDCYNDKVVRSSMGSIFSMNLIYMEESDILSLLEEREYKSFVTALAKDSIDYNMVKLVNRNAIVFGNEGQGVSDNFLKIADNKVIIPIYGTAESLNVAVASGIMLYKVRELLNAI
ncbi:MAG: TrmH family RNA methyltransferase [Fusobacteriaceae bacterium]